MPATSYSLPALLLVTTAVIFGALSWLGIDHYQPWASFYNDFAAFFAVWALVAYLALINKATTEYRLPFWALGIVTVALAPLLQATTGVVFFAGDAYIASAYLIGFAAAYSTGFLFGARDKTRFVLGMAWLFLTSALLSVAIALYQWLDLEGLGILVVNLVHGVAPYGNLGMTNNLATLLCLGVAAAIYLRLCEKINGPVAILVALPLIFGLALTQSRTPWLGAGLLLLWWLLKRRFLSGLSAPVLILLALCYALLVFNWPQVTHSATELSLPAAKSANLGEREAMWTGLLDAALRAPWWGYGWNQVSVAQIAIAADYPQPSKFSHSHNLLLDLLLWNGFLLGTVIIASLGAWLANRAWRCKSKESWFGLLAIGFVLVHAMFEFPLEFAYFLLPVGLLAGLVDADQGVRARLPVPKPALVSFLVVSALFMGLVWHEYRIVEADYRLMRFETARIGFLKAAQPAPDLILLTQLREDLRMARSLARENMSAEELEWMRKITYRYPYYSNLFRYAVSLALNGRREEASLEFRRLHNLFGEAPYQNAKELVGILTTTQYPSLSDWRLP